MSKVITCLSSLRDVSGIKQNLRTYGGFSCTKIGITLEGKNYLLKYPANLQAKDSFRMTDRRLNSSYSEYVGSKIFEMFYIPVHKVELVKRNDTICALCEDFVKSGRLVEIGELKATYEDGFVCADGQLSAGNSNDLDETLTVIRSHPVAKLLPDFEEFFWNMFIVDTLLGNLDRAYDNFGIIVDNDSVSLAPVYDNGNCLAANWSINKISRYLGDRECMERLAYGAFTCSFRDKGECINPYELIRSGKYKGCTEALGMLKPLLLEDIIAVINEAPIPDLYKNFYTELITIRFNYLREILNDLT